MTVLRVIRERGALGRQEDQGASLLPVQPELKYVLDNVIV